MAAALQIRASRSPPAAAPALHILRQVHIHHPLGRRGPSSAPLKIQARTRRDPFRSHCEKRNLHEPEPEPEPEPNCPLVEEMLKKLQDARAAAGIRETPDMFVTEKKRISSYQRKVTAASSDIEEMLTARSLCDAANDALNLASYIMDTASIRRGTTRFSQHTMEQMVRTYAAVFCNVAEDAYHKKFEMGSFLSFVFALRCLAAMYHVLVQDTVAKLEDGHLKNSITFRMSKLSQALDEVLKHFEDRFVKSKARGPRVFLWKVKCYLPECVVFARAYVVRLAEFRETALGYLKGSSMRVRNQRIRVASPASDGASDEDEDCEMVKKFKTMILSIGMGMEGEVPTVELSRLGAHESLFADLADKCFD